MKSFLATLALTALCAVVLISALHPERGVLFQSPGAALGLGLVGLGLCMEARKRLGPHAPPAMDR